jgi:hypothetical protein
MSYRQYMATFREADTRPAWCRYIHLYGELERTSWGSS